MIDPVEGKRQGALTFGATDVLVPGEDIATRVRAITDGYGADYTIDAVGSPGLLPQAFASTVVGGTVVCVGVSVCRPPMRARGCPAPTWSARKRL